LAFGQNRICAYPSAQKASGKAFVPAAGFFICINHKRADKPIAAKIKASTKKAIPFSQKFDEVIISEENTQRKYCFLICMDFFSGFLRCKNSCRNPFKIRQLLHEV
jgi:hypothetical protein